MANEEIHLQARMYGETMRAMCAHCEAGLPTLSVFGSPPPTDADYITIHKGTDGEWLPCDAQAMHFLVDSLLAELNP
jgi:hypothetical protein